MHGTKVILSHPERCGGHATLKGHRIEVSNLVSNMYYQKMTDPADWIAHAGADSWITPGEVMHALRYCRGQQCVREGITCCHCSLNPEEGQDPDDDPFHGWKLAAAVLRGVDKDGFEV